MPDINLLNFTKTEGAAAQVTVPDTVITAQVFSDGDLIADYTGPNALHYPAVLASLPPATRAELTDQIAQAIVLAMAGAS